GPRRRNGRGQGSARRTSVDPDRASASGNVHHDDHFSKRSPPSPREIAAGSTQERTTESQRAQSEHTERRPGQDKRHRPWLDASCPRPVYYVLCVCCAWTPWFSAGRSPLSAPPLQ